MNHSEILDKNMRHIKNFRNFTINELMDWAVLPTDVNKGLGDMINNLFTELKNYLEKAATKMGLYLSQLREVFLKIIDSIEKQSQRDKKELFDSLFKVFNATDGSTIESKLKREPLLSNIRNYSIKNETFDEFGAFVQDESPESVSDKEMKKDITYSVNRFFEDRLKPLFKCIINLKYIIGIVVSIFLGLGFSQGLLFISAIIILCFLMSMTDDDDEEVNQVEKSWQTTVNTLTSLRRDKINQVKKLVKSFTSIGNTKKPGQAPSLSSASVRKSV